MHPGRGNILDNRKVLRNGKSPMSRDAVHFLKGESAKVWLAVVKEMKPFFGAVDMDAGVRGGTQGIASKGEHY